MKAEEPRSLHADTDLRYEIKLVCDRHRLPQARSWVRLHPAGFRVAYPPRQVHSLYLDTPHLSSLNENLAGVSPRQKLRLRWYGDETTTTIQPYLELKQKRDLLGRKRRYLLPCRLDMSGPWREILKTIRIHTGPDWQALLQTANRPTLLNRYWREYYATPDGGIRITLDFDQVAYDQRFGSRPNLSAQLPIADAVVLEIKTTLEQANRLPEVVARFPVLRSRNSKYVGGLRVAVG